MKRIRWWVLVAMVALASMGFSIYRTVAAGPANVARASDRATAARDIPAKGGGPDDRDTLASAGYVSGSGVVEPADRETRVAGSVPGRIARIHVRERDTVVAGAPLVELESATEQAAVDAAEADVAVQAASLARTAKGLRAEDVEALVDEAGAAKARADNSAEILARDEKLAETGAVARDEVDRARRQAEADQRTFDAADARRLAGVHGGRREDVAVAQAQLRAAMARRDQARAELERLTIRAPLDGTVLQLKYRIGEYYNPASPSGVAVEPLVVLGDLRSIRVRMDVDERDIARVKPGAPGYVTLSAFPDHPFAGKVVEIGARMGRKNVRTDDPVERLDVKILEVVLRIDEPAGLVPGIRVTAYVEAKSGA
jgi:multidrug resistance efflux pump